MFHKEKEINTYTYLVIMNDPVIQRNSTLQCVCHGTPLRLGYVYDVHFQIVYRLHRYNVRTKTFIQFKSNLCVFTKLCVDGRRQLHY